MIHFLHHLGVDNFGEQPGDIFEPFVVRCFYFNMFVLVFHKKGGGHAVAIVATP
jgi:hypothetical protein